MKDHANDGFAEILNRADDLESGVGQPSPLRRSARKAPLKKTRMQRIVIELGNGRTVTIHGADPSIEGVISVLDDVLGKARRVRRQGLELATFLMMLHDLAQAGSLPAAPTK